MRILMLFAAMSLAICAAADDTETVISTFRVKAGKEAEFAAIHAQAWPSYRRFRLVLDAPHLVMRGKDDAGKTYFVEILIWKSHDAPDHAPKEIQTIWSKLEALCEPRDGHRGIEFPEVQIVRSTLQ